MKFSHISNLLRHIRIHNGIRPFLCEYCLKCFSSSSNLKQHYNIHEDFRIRCRYTCLSIGCNRSYLYVCTLKKHMLNDHYNEFKDFFEKYKNIRLKTVYNDINNYSKILIIISFIKKVIYKILNNFYEIEFMINHIMDNKIN
jgi:hypothetical protein